MKYSYVISPVAYVNGKEVDRTYDSVRFDTREQADKFIEDMGSRWVMYPNIEIHKVPGNGKSFSRKDARLVVGYGETGEYSPVARTKVKKSIRKSKTSRGKPSTSLGSMR